MFKKSYSQKKGDRSRPWYTPGNKREKPVGHVTQCRPGSRCWGLGLIRLSPCGYDPAKCEGQLIIDPFVTIRQECLLRALASRTPSPIYSSLMRSAAYNMANATIIVTITTTNVIISCYLHLYNMKSMAKIQPRVKKSLRCIASKPNETGSKTRFWSKNRQPPD